MHFGRHGMHSALCVPSATGDVLGEVRDSDKGPDRSDGLSVWHSATKGVVQVGVNLI